jgi:Fic family protein
MEKLLYFFNESETKGLSRKEDQPFIHPIIRAIIVHFMIGHIHPFYDGNGRIARALFYWHMLANGYWLAEYLSISQIILKSKSQYYRAFQQVEKDENDLTYFMQYHLKALGQAFDQLIEYLDRKLKTQTNAVVDLAGQYGITTRQAEILAIINKSQTVWTAQQIQTKLHVSANTARTALNELTEIGLLERLALDKKTQGWRLV